MEKGILFERKEVSKERKVAWSVDACLIGAHTSHQLADWGVNFFHRSNRCIGGGGANFFCEGVLYSDWGFGKI